MAFVVKDRVQETTTTVGTGTYTLAGAVTGYQSFSAIGNANTTYYTVTNDIDWEVGLGTYTAAGTTLSRDSILASSNSNNAVNWGAGTKRVFVDYPAGKAVIDGQSFNGTVGATTPSTGAFTTLSASGVATFSAGSAAAPAITTSGDTNNGIFFPAADVTAISTAGTERMRVDASGNLGLGVTPSAWSGIKAIQITNGATLGGDGSNFYQTANAFYDGTNWKYIGSNFACYVGTGLGNFIWYTAASGTAGATVSFSERLRITNAGLLTFGGTTSSFPALKRSSTTLQVRLADDSADAPLSGDSITLSSGSAAVLMTSANPGIRQNGSSGGFIYFDVATGGATHGSFVWRSSSAFTERLRIDTSGNLGLGVTPSAWEAGNRAIDFGGSSAIWQGAVGQNAILRNAYYNGTSWIYKTTAAASRFNQSADGSFFWSIAPSGTAGNAISFTQAMTLDASGNLGVGSTSPAFSAGGGIHISKATQATIRLTSGASNFDIGSNNNALYFYDASAAAERMRITNLGLLAFGGGATSSFPALKRNSTTLQVRLADDSGYAPLESGALTVSGNATFDTNTLFVDATNNWVGIGTATPSNKLEVYDATSAVVAVQSDALAQTNLLRASTDTGSAGHFLRKARGTVASPSAVSSGDNAGFVRFQAYGGTNYRNLADIIGNVTTYTSDTSISGSLLFRTNNASTDVTEKARITNDGKFLLGSTNTAINAGMVNSVSVAHTSAAGHYTNTTISSSTTNIFNGYQTDVSTTAASFTLPALAHFSANQATIGAGSVVTNQYGFIANSNLIGATNDYGFYSDIASGSGRWNFYANGTADNYFAGNVGIGRTPSYTLDVNSTARFNSTIGVGNAAPAASGAGISFPATQSASSDANTLDDYEESTWTPTDGSGAGLTFTDVTARYTKIGNVVTVFAKLTYPSTVNASQAKINGLPFAATDGGNLTYCSSSTTTSGAGHGYIVAGTTTATLVTQTSAARSNAQLSTLVLYFSGTYLT